jgi:thiamine biosynthesis protein ThiS
VNITLNGDPFEVAGSLTISELLAQLQVDARRVAVEHNLVVLKRAAFETTRLSDNDEVEIVNFVGGGEGHQRMHKCRNAGMQECRNAGR